MNWLNNVTGLAFEASPVFLFYENIISYLCNKNFWIFMAVSLLAGITALGILFGAATTFREIQDWFYRKAVTEKKEKENVSDNI